MKKFCLLIIFLVSVFTLNAQKFSAGIHESHYIYGIYRPVEHLNIRLSHSLYSEKIGFQRIGAAVSYETALPHGFRIEAGGAGAVTWNGNYGVCWAFADAGYTYRRLGLHASIQPRYDSGLGYKTCWEAGASVRIIRPISILARYTTIPEYRMSEKRIAGGFEFHVPHLTVRPELSLSMESGTRFKNLRVLMSMQYDF